MSYTFSRNPIEVLKINTKNREIKTAIPAPGTDELLTELESCESRSMQGQMPIVWDRAENFSVYDHCGNKWIDFTSTIFVTNVGHGNKYVINSVRHVLDKSIVHTYAYANKIRNRYIKKLIEFSDGDFEKAFLLSAGTEATEAALKLMRMNGQKNKKCKLGIICIEGNWHGRTMGAQLMSSNVEQKKWIGFNDPDIHHIAFPYPWVDGVEDGTTFLNAQLKKLEEKGVNLKEDICGVMLETFQGWGAVFYPESFVQAIRKISQGNNILLAFDEMQAGFARTGKSFGYKHYDVTPDLICCGKGMGSGFPISAVLGKTNIMDLPSTGNMSSTHSANPVVCAAGLATIEEIEKGDLINETARKGVILFKQLNALKTDCPNLIGNILGKGLIAAVIFKDFEGKQSGALFASQVSERCMQKGLLVVHTGRESIKIGPPLTITDDALIEGVAVLKESIEETLKEIGHDNKHTACGHSH